MLLTPNIDEYLRRAQLRFSRGNNVINVTLNDLPQQLKINLVDEPPLQSLVVDENNESTSVIIIDTPVNKVAPKSKLISLVHSRCEIQREDINIEETGKREHRLLEWNILCDIIARAFNLSKKRLIFKRISFFTIRKRLLRVQLLSRVISKYIRVNISPEIKCNVINKLGKDKLAHYYRKLYLKKFVLKYWIISIFRRDDVS